MNQVVAGLLAGVPLSVLGVVYILLRGQAFVAMLSEATTDPSENMPESALRFMMWGMFVGGPLLFGVIASLVYGAVGSAGTFLAMALGIAVVASILALVTRTPMPVDKIVANFAVALVLGVLVPLLAERLV